MNPVIVQPDLEAWVIANTRDLPGLTVFSYAANQLDPAGWLFAHFLQIDVRRDRKPAARDIAERARQRMVALPGIRWPDGTVCYCQPAEGPFYLPDDDGQPRYVARYEVRVHPVRPPAALPEGA
jgi:hypothetical protein